MKWMAVASALGTFLIVASVFPAVSFAQDGGDSQAPGARRASKPAAPREQDRAEPAARKVPAVTDDSATPANITDPEAYQRELQAAKEKRDRDLKDAAKETDRRKFEKRKEQIFAQYAAIISEMRERFEAHESETGAPPKSTQRSGKTSRPGTFRPGSTDRSGTTERPGRPEARRTSVRRDYDEAMSDDVPPPRGTAKSSTKSNTKSRSRGGDDTLGSLADAQKRLDDENARHESAMDQLNQQLKDAQASKNKREIRKAERAIDKENTAFDAKRALLESRVKELGGTVERPRPAIR